MDKKFTIYMDKTIGVNGTKPKSVIIDGNLHSNFKMLCKGKSMKIGGVIEDLIKLYLHDPKNLQRMIDELKDRTVITNRVTGEQVKIG
jgi:hypothetical protein